MNAEWCVIVEIDPVEFGIVAYKAKAPSGTDWLYHTIQAEMIEHTRWELNNHQSGDLWLDEMGKLNGREPTGAVTREFRSPMLLDQLVGPLVLTGDSTGDELVLLKEALADELVRCLQGNGPLRVMGGYFMQLARCGV